MQMLPPGAWGDMVGRALRRGSALAVIVGAASVSGKFASVEGTSDLLCYSSCALLVFDFSCWEGSWPANAKRDSTFGRPIIVHKMPA